MSWGPLDPALWPSGLCPAESKSISGCRDPEPPHEPLGAELGAHKGPGRGVPGLTSGWGSRKSAVGFAKSNEKLENLEKEGGGVEHDVPTNSLVFL
jgi:hypothetical protein